VPTKKVAGTPGITPLPSQEGSSGRLRASIVGERAGETIKAIAIVMLNKLKLADLVATIHPYPTGIQLEATMMVVEHAFSGTSGRILPWPSALWR